MHKMKTIQICAWIKRERVNHYSNVKAIWFEKRRKREWKKKKRCLLNEPPIEKLRLLFWIEFQVVYFSAFSSSSSSSWKSFQHQIDAWYSFGFCFLLFNIQWLLSPFATWCANVLVSMEPLDFNYFYWERELPKSVFWMRLPVLSIACCLFVLLMLLSSLFTQPFIRSVWLCSLFHGFCLGSKCTSLCECDAHKNQSKS